MKGKGLLTILVISIGLINDIWSIIDRLFVESNQKLTTILDMDIVLLIIKGGLMFAGVYFILYKYDTAIRQIQASNIVNHLRNEYYFLKDFEKYTYYRLPNETDEQLFKRLPKNELNTYLQNEYFKAKNIMQNKYNLTPKEVTKYLDKVYGIDRKKSIKK